MSANDLTQFSDFFSILFSPGVDTKVFTPPGIPSMRQGPLVCGINIAVNDWFLVEVADQERAIYGNVDTTLFRHLPHC